MIPAFSSIRYRLSFPNASIGNPAFDFALLLILIFVKGAFREMPLHDMGYSALPMIEIMGYLTSTTFLTIALVWC